MLYLQVAENFRREHIYLQNEDLQVSMTVNITADGEILGLGSKMRVLRDLGGYGNDPFEKHVRADFVPQKDDPSKAQLHRIYTVLRGPIVIYDVSVMKDKNFNHHKSKFEKDGFYDGLDWKEIATAYLSQ